jgi:hypothetical protein
MTGLVDNRSMLDNLLNSNKMMPLKAKANLKINQQHVKLEAAISFEIGGFKQRTINSAPTRDLCL